MLFHSKNLCQSFSHYGLPRYWQLLGRPQTTLFPFLCAIQSGLLPGLWCSLLHLTDISFFFFPLLFCFCLANIPFPLFGSIFQFPFGEPLTSLLLAPVFPNEFYATCSFKAARLSYNNQQILYPAHGYPYREKSK